MCTALLYAMDTMTTPETTFEQLRALPRIPEPAAQPQSRGPRAHWKSHPAVCTHVASVSSGVPSARPARTTKGGLA